METTVKAYKSSRRKLVQFFEKSRDKWKTKCPAAKRLIKRLKNRLHFLEASKERWRIRAHMLEEQLEELKARDKAKEEQVEELKKNLELKMRTRQV